MGTYKSQDIGGAVEASLRAGYRHCDCASHYGNEPLIGEAFTKILKEGVIKREQLFITSKLWYDPSSVSHGGVYVYLLLASLLWAVSCRNDDHEGHKVRPALEKTLKDLNLDYIDLFLVRFLRKHPHDLLLSPCLGVRVPTAKLRCGWLM